eukprot:354403-Prymnesium_polylepis.1
MLSKYLLQDDSSLGEVHVAGLPVARKWLAKKLSGVQSLPYPNGRAQSPCVRRETLHSHALTCSDMP